MYIFMNHKYYFQKHYRPMNYFLTFGVDKTLKCKS